MSEIEHQEQDLFEYYKELMVRTFGEENYWKIIDALSEVPNGFCGVELYYATFPGLLRARGVKPQRDYVSEYRFFGPPREDGKQAATPEQRKVIWDSLRAAGFAIE